jgi:hypothetical protein
MDFKTITDKESVQYEIQQQAYTDDCGFRKIGSDYIVAIGTAYTDQCGDRFLVKLKDISYENDVENIAYTEFTITVGDIKSDLHTDNLNMYTPMANSKGNLLEFIVDTDKMSEEVLKTGCVSSIGLKGEVVEIKKIIMKEVLEE